MEDPIITLYWIKCPMEDFYHAVWRADEKFGDVF